jgi:hypothetical protein
VTPHQERVTAGRIDSPAAAESMARLMDAWGSDKAFIASQPKRKWVQGANGLWSSHDPVIERQRTRAAQ